MEGKREVKFKVVYHFENSKGIRSRGPFFKEEITIMKNRAEKLFNKQQAKRESCEFRKMSRKKYEAEKGGYDFDHVYDNKLKGVWIRPSKEEAGPLSFVIGLSMIGLALWGMKRISEGAEKERKGK